MTTSPVSIPVALDRVPSYDFLSQSYIASLLQSISFDGDELSGKKVLLKPNLVSGKAQSHGCTHPLFVRAIALYFLAKGASVIVGDSPALGSAQNVAKAHGLTDALKDIDVPIVNFDRKVATTLETGHKIYLAEDIFECDLLVNLPKIKAHGQMHVSLGIKNCFGLVVGMQKGLLHMTQGGAAGKFVELILALQNCLPANICIGDGIVAMHKSGPISGEILNLQMIGASRSSVAFDSGVTAALGLNCTHSPLLIGAQECGLVGAHIQECSFPRLSPGDFSGSGFIAPESLIPIRFNPFRFVKSTLKRVIH